MADEATTTETAETGGDGAAAAAAGKTFTQDDLDRVVKDRLAKERQKFGDYDALKDKASKFDELSESQKTEAQKALDKLSATEERATTAERKLLRYEVAADKKIPVDAVDLLNGTTREEMEAQADRILALTAANSGGSQFDGGVRGQGTQPPGMDGLLRQAAGFRR